jgi:hypothetical protein
MAEHRQRLLADGKIQEPEPCADIESSHWWELQLLVDLQFQVASDPVMTFADRIRNTVAIAQAMARIAPLADLEAKILKLEEANRDQILEFQQAQDRLELEYKTKLETMRNRCAGN